MRTKQLICGCCGQYFRTWESYKNQDQDAGYGICKSCQNNEGDKYIQEIEKGFNLILSTLKGKDNIKKANKMLFPEREAIVLQAWED